MLDIVDPSVVRKARKFLKKQKYAVIATVSSESKPQAATVYYVMNGRDLYFITEISTRKFQNALKNPQIAAVVGFGPKLVGMQLEGVVELTYEGSEKIRKLMHDHPALSKNPYGRWIYANLPKIGHKYVILKVRVEWIRYIDYRNEHGPFVVIPMNQW